MNSIQATYGKQIATFGAIASAICIYLTKLHYSPSESSICNISDTLNCDIVNASTYSEIYGIPVAVLGLGFYLIVTAFGIALAYASASLKNLDLKDITKGFLVLTGVGTLFSLYLTYHEAFTIKAYCIMCLAQQVLILILLYLFYKLYKKM